MLVLALPSLRSRAAHCGPSPAEVHAAVRPVEAAIRRDRKVLTRANSQYAGQTTVSLRLRQGLVLGKGPAERRHLSRGTLSVAYADYLHRI